MLKPEPGLRPEFIFQARFVPERQIYRVMQDTRDCEVLLRQQSKQN